MMKFFRKYTKHLLVVFMSLLLVVWLAPSSMFRGGPTQEDEAVGKAFGRTVRYRDLMPAYNQTQTLDLLVPFWRMPWYYALHQLGLTDPRALQHYGRTVREEELSPTEWYMLTAEARHSGVHVTAEAVEQFKRDHIGPRDIRAVRDRRRVSLEHIDRALHSFLQVQEAALLACRAVQISEADVQYFVRQAKERVSVSIVALKAAQFLDPSYEPGDQELKEHFDQYKNTASRPAGGLEFGYQLPEAVQIEYIRVNVQALTDRQTISDEEAFRYWKDHTDEFTRPATQPATATKPKTPPKAEPYTTFTEARGQVLEKLQRARAEEEALRIARDLIVRLNQPWEGAPTTQPGNYRQPPESETAADVYPRLIDGFQSKYPGVLSYARAHLLEHPALRRHPEIGRLTALRGTKQQIRLDRAAFLTAGLEARPEDNPDHARYFQNVYETCAEPFVDFDGNAFVWRTVAIRPKQPPPMSDTLREKLIADLRDLHAYEEAERRARALAEQAAEVGLEQALEAVPALKERLGDSALLKPEPFSRREGPRLYSEIGHDRDFVETCFSLGGQETTRPARVAVHEQRPREQWLVVQWHQTFPVTRAEYDEQRSSAIPYYRLNRQMEVLKSWFDEEQIRARIGWSVDAQAEAEKPSQPAS